MHAPGHLAGASLVSQRISIISSYKALSVHQVLNSVSPNWFSKHESSRRKSINIMKE